MSYPRKPSKLKVIEGTWRADRAPHNEAQPEPAVPSPPPHLSEEARAEWDRLTSELAAIGLLSRIDRAALAAYCEHWADWVDACRHCATKDGMDRKVLRTKIGNFVENPYFSIKKRSAELMYKFLVEFGMTPAARSRINTVVDNTDGRQKTDKDKDYA